MMPTKTPEYKRGETFFISADNSYDNGSDMRGVYVALEDISAKRLQQVASYAAAAYRNKLADGEDGEAIFIAKMQSLGLIEKVNMREMALCYIDRQLNVLEG